MYTIRFIIVISLFFCISADMVSQINQEAARDIIEGVQRGDMSREEAIQEAREAGATDQQIQQGVQEGEQRDVFDQQAQFEQEAAEEIQEQLVAEDTIREGTAREGEIQEEEEDAAEPKAPQDRIADYFGYSLFTGSSDKYLPAQVGPSDPDYLLGPGDEIIVSLWGQVEQRYPLTISKEGTVFIENYGQMVVTNLTLSQLETKLTKRLSKIHKSLNPPTGAPTTYLDVSLGKLKSYTVFTVGYVKNPGSHQVNSYSTLFTALFQAGGPTLKGSLRDIRLIRDDEVVVNLDLYDFLLTGKKKDDNRIQNNDIIYIPPRISSVELNGEVNDTSIFELKKDETLRDLVDFAGGLKSTTDINRVQIERIQPFEGRESARRIIQVIDRKLLVEKDGQMAINPIPLSDKDVVTIYPLNEPVLGYVTVSGSVKRPGRFSLEDNMSIQDLIAKAQGLLPDAYTSKADLTRTYRDGTTRHFSLNLDSAVADTLMLEDWDELRVYSFWELFDREYVRISGHVRNPGSYMLHDSLYASDLIFKAGGMKDKFFWSQTYQRRADLIRYNEDGLTTRIIPLQLDSIVAGNPDYDIKLINQDRIRIYPANVTFFPDVVSIEGEIKNPGQYTLKTNMDIQDIILEAGGFTRSAYKYVADVYRIDPLMQKEDTMTLAFSVSIAPDILERLELEDGFQLEGEDYVVIREDPHYETHRVVHIYGEVEFPGAYPLLRKNETLQDLINRAGGLTNEAFKTGIRFTRNDSLQVVGDYEEAIEKGEKLAMILKTDDRIFIPRHPGTVKVEGAVNNPGLVQYRKGWRLDDYIEAAGDYTFDADENHTIVYYPGGNAKRISWGIAPKVREGSRVVVPVEPEMEPIDWTQLLAEWASIASSLATVIFIINRSSN